MRGVAIAVLFLQSLAICWLAVSYVVLLRRLGDLQQNIQVAGNMLWPARELVLRQPLPAVLTPPDPLLSNFVFVVTSDHPSSYQAVTAATVFASSRELPVVAWCVDASYVAAAIPEQFVEWPSLSPISDGQFQALRSRHELLTGLVQGGVLAHVAGNLVTLDDCTRHLDVFAPAPTGAAPAVTR